jgi:translation initiation factor 3 subunit G
LTDPTITNRHDWADDDDIEETTSELPPTQTISNKDGTKTIISYRINEDGNKVKTTRRVRYTTHKETVNPRVADRKTWTKFGQSAKDGAGPAPDTTSVAENIMFRPSINWRKDAQEENTEQEQLKDKLKDKKVKCRICNGEHFTARCPYKDTMAPVGANGAADVAAGLPDEAGAASAGAGPAGKKGSYVPPALRGDRPAGERMGGKFGERDDFATLRVTNVSLKSPHSAGVAGQKLTVDARCLRWQKRASCATCLSGSAASPGCSWQRTGRRVWPRALHLSASRITATPSRRAARWTVSASSISFSGWNLRRRPSKRSLFDFCCMVYLGTWVKNASAIVGLAQLCRVLW